MSKKKFGLALGGGAARGLAHIGVIKALEKAGIKPDFIAGTSIGAIIGGIYAAGYNAEELEKMTKNVGGKFFWSLFRLSLHHNGFIDGENMIHFFKILIKDRNIESMPIPFSAVATDFYSGKKYIFNHGSLFIAMRASSSIPVLFTPSVAEGKTFIDGAFSGPVPVRTTREMGAEVILAVNVLPEIETTLDRHGKNKSSRQDHERRTAGVDLPLLGLGARILPKPAMFMPGLLDITLHTRDIVEYNLMKADIERNKPEFLVQPNIDNYVGWFDFRRLDELIRNGVVATEKIIPELKGTLAG